MSQVHRTLHTSLAVYLILITTTLKSNFIIGCIQKLVIKLEIEGTFQEVKLHINLRNRGEYFYGE